MDLLKCTHISLCFSVGLYECFIKQVLSLDNVVFKKLSAQMLVKVL